MNYSRQLLYEIGIGIGIGIRDVNDLNEPPLNEDDIPLFLSSDPTEEEYTQSDEEFEDFLNNQWDVEQENSIDGDAIDNHEEANEDLPLPQVVTINKRGKNMSNDTRRDIYEMLLKKSVDGKLGRNATREVSSHFSVPILSVQRIWKRAKDCGAHVDVSHKMSRGGRKRVEIDLEKIRDVPLHKRTTIESLAHALDVKKTTLFRLIKSGKIRKHSNAIKPFLKEENKRARLQFCIKMIDANSIPNNPTFVGICVSKNFLPKVMFLAAVARPRFDSHRNVTFDGKIGVFPFVIREPAKRTSVNRVAGTMETKPILSVTRAIIRSFYINKVLPSVMDKWPIEDIGNPIFIQQDNARTHIDIDDEEFCEAAKKNGFDIRLMCQPPNSPELNVLDLGFFSCYSVLTTKKGISNY
ncbi:uncharacterized protein [Medicago truncatula]|uniref:uncharacterized protein n=1 Tax=Medicago truncatula TaxID=3880 RepID=UPI0019688D94|nr:uncharacterized protein LOC112417400 [Medicago truncatula]